MDLGGDDMIYNASGNPIYTESGFAVHVAAIDSTNSDKAKAEYLCTGTNDEVVIQSAIDSLTNGGVVYLATGNYHIDGWNYDTNGYKSAICIKNTGAKSVKISGMSFPLRKYGSHDLGNSAILRVSDTALSTLDGTESRVSVIGYGGNSRKYPSYVLDVENLGITLADNQHAVICIDGKFFTAMFVRNVMCAVDANAYTSLDSGADYDYPVDDCIAIRGLDGSNFGAGYRLSNIFVFGFGVGYLINGEHLIAEQLGCRFCNYSYKFGYDVEVGAMTHDLTLINCCHEICSRYPTFHTQRHGVVNLYDYNVEDSASDEKFATVSKAVDETTPKNFHGRVYYTVSPTTNYVNADVAFWEDGNGEKSITVNTAFPK